MYRNIRLAFKEKITRSISRIIYYSIIHYYRCFEFFVFTIKRYLKIEEELKSQEIINNNFFFALV